MTKFFAALLVLSPIIIFGCMSQAEISRQNQAMIDQTMRSVDLQMQIINYDIKNGMAPAAAADHAYQMVEGDPARFRQELQQQRLQEDLEKYLEYRTPY